MEADEVECSFTVQESCVNSIGTMHGGFTATLVDVVGTLALLARQQDKPGVSVDINVSYLSGVRVGDKVRCVGKVLRMGNSLGFTNVDLFRQDNGKLVATGRHTKAFPKNMVPT
ncbi:hypothetical protein BASA81_002972 [Batrachochytrium salamandrivorans]|nr:hypothetical protein BASA81_002972 [Batrachochytrium salamandrivorans]